MDKQMVSGCTTEKLKAISKEVLCLEEKLTEMSEVIDTLRNKLHPILSTEKPYSESPPIPVTGVPLADNLICHNSKLSQLTNNIRDLLDRLEL